MFKQLSYKLTFISALVLLSIMGKAGVTPFQAVIETKFSPTFIPVTVSSNSTVSISPMTDLSYNDVSVVDFVTLAVDHKSNRYVITAGDIVVGLKVERYNNSNVLTNTDFPSLQLKYQPFPSTGLPYVDKSVYKVTGAYRVTVTVQSMTVNGSAVSELPSNLIIQSDILLERYVNFSSNLSTSITMITPVVKDIDCDSKPDEIEIKWSPLTGAEEYQLEWAFVNDYTSTSGMYKSTGSLNYNFRDNSTRITTVKPSYKINLNFDHGYLVYRVKGIGRDFTKTAVPLPGAWNVANSGLLSSVPALNRYAIDDAHESNKNWQYSSTYAEEGKKKEVISYFDGSLRNRQTATKINTDSSTIVGETIYDFQGRPAVNILPAPVQLASCTKTALRYIPNLNRSDGTAYEFSREDFDKDKVADACSSKLNKLDKGSGAARYYSSSNSQRAFPQANFIPDAFQYPFSQTEYTPDNTGRIRRQGGVGGRFQLDSAHATWYYYGSPAQQQIDRLFGSEAGDASHYKKNIVGDANGQYSITYLDQEGRTVATALAGDGPSYMDTLMTPNKNTGSLNSDLFNKDIYGVSKKNTVSVQGDAIEFGAPLLVAFPNSYTFNYDIKIAQFPQGCLKTGVCFNCIYNLEILVKDDCGRVVAATSGSNPINKMIGRFTPDGSGNFSSFNTTCVGTDYTNAQTFTLFLQPGNYMITKILTVNKDAKDYYVGKYFETTNTPVQGTYVNLQSGCIKTYQQFVDAALTKIDTNDCHISCSACVAALKGSYTTIELARDGFVADGKGTELDFDYLIEQCNASCKEISTCEAAYQAMLMDVSPDGQYGEYRKREDGTGPDMNLSVYNTQNFLSKDGFQTTHWKNPIIIINGNTYAAYIDKKGVRTKIKVKPKSVTDLSKGFSPEVDYTSNVSYDPATQTYYTYPQYLKNIHDFIANWDDNWAKSLVRYHPEYVYYQSCQEYSKKFATYNLTSDAFDSVLVSCPTFALAQSVNYRLLSGTTSSDMILFNKASQIVQDPFAFNANFPNYSNDLNYQITTNFANTGLSMQAYAAKAARCGTMYGVTQPNLPSSCTSFGTGSDVTILNNEWNILKNLYLSTKKELQKKRDEARARANKSYNGCFGNPNFDPITSGMMPWPTVPAFSDYGNPTQPCSYWMKQFYINKTRRFNLNNANNVDLPSKEENDYQMYLQTNQTPMELNVQGLVSRLAKDILLTSTSDQPLQGFPEFTRDLYTAVYGSTSLPATYVPYFWKAISVNPNTLNTVIKDASANKATFAFSKSTTAFTWNQIVSISQFKYTSGTAPNFGFKAVAAVANPIGSIRPYTYYDITGTTSFVLNNYNPTPSTLSKCKTNQLALDLATLWTALALNNKLYQTSEYTLSTADYGPFITTSIKNILGTTNSTLKWKYVPGAPIKYELYDVTSKKLVMQEDSASTSNFVNFINMGVLNTPNGNAFRVSGKTTAGTDAGKMKGSINLVTTVSTPVSLGNCDLPVNVLCTENEYQNGRDLSKLLKNVMLSKPFNNNPDLTKNVGYTPLLESYLNGSIQASTAKYDNLVLNGANDYKEQITYNMACECQVRLWHNGKGTQIIKFADLSGLSSLEPYGPAGIDNNKYKFYMLASYAYMSTTVNDTIFGESCFPLRTCNTKVTADTSISPVKPYVNPCIMNQLNIAALNAQTEFKKYKDSLLTDLSGRYNQHCLGAFENLKEVYKDKEYHYTLYYYDQAGNLVKTIPPEGVELDTASFAINKDRTLNRHDHFTRHRMATTYTYNSLNQLVRQNVPDHEQMDIWEYTLSNGLDSRLKVMATQFVSATKGYLSGYIDVAGTPPFNRGHLYTTDDGGITWTRIKNLVASDLKKIQMVNASIGYAVGTNGTVLKTQDGGNTWDMLSVPATATINDLHFVTNQTPTPLNGIIIGENNTILITKDGGASWLTASTGGNLTDSLRAGSSLTSITNDGGYLFMTGNVNGSGYIYRAQINSFSTGSFNINMPWARLTPVVDNSGIRSADIIKVNMVDKNRGFAVAVDGNLLKTTDAGSNWISVPTGIAKEFRDIAFIKMNGLSTSAINGVAIIDSIPGKGLLYQTNDGGMNWKQLSLNDGNYYNAVYFLQENANRDRGYAVGSAMKRIVYKNNNFVLVNVPMPTTIPTDLKTVYFSTPNSGWVASASTAYYTSTAMAAVPAWSSVVLPDFTMRKLYFGSVQNTGIALSQDGAVYKIVASGSSYAFTKISTTEYYTDLGTTSTHVFALNKLGSPNVIYYVNKNSINGAGSLTGLNGSGGMTSTNAAALYTFDADSAGSVILAGGADGRLFKGAATSTTVVWNDYSRRVTPLPLYDIEAPCSNTIVAVGAEGTLLQCTDRNTFRTIPTGTVTQFNAAKFNRNGYSATGAVKGVIGGSGGLLTRINITASPYQISLLPLKIITAADLNDVAVKDNGAVTQAYAAGSDGSVIQVASLDAPNPVLSNTKGSSAFSGVTFSATGNDVYTAGNNSAIYNYQGLTGTKLSGIFTPGLFDVSFVNGMNGYVIGDKNLIRYTADGGASWKYVRRAASANAMNAVCTYAPGRAVIVGNSGYVGRTNEAVAVLDSTLTGTYYDVEFSGTKGIMVGTSALKLAVNTNQSLKYTTTSGFPASTTFKGVHLFANGNSISAGAGGKIYVYNNTTWINVPLPGGVTPSLNDVFFHDDRNGYVVGDGGTLYRAAASNFDVSGLTGAPPSNPWTLFSLSGVNGAANPALINLTTVAFSDRYKGFLGGYASSGTPVNFARVVNDETNLFSTRFWYDALGRMVLSQNTKQYRKKLTQSGRGDYSYTMYDNLGRIVEVGEKSDTTAGAGLLPFYTIMGDYVNGKYNPYVISSSVLNSWLTTGSKRREVTRTFYDVSPWVPVGVLQNNLRKRVAAVVYEDREDGTDSTYQHASYYSYDIHGNVKTLWQHNRNVPTWNLRLKRVDYEYDLISGKVNLVRYQDGKADCFYHYYAYDGDNRLTDVYTSSYPWPGQLLTYRFIEKNPLWSREAKYFYYAHGPLARAEVGENISQGIDYAYTLQGWLKGVNNDVLNPDKDMGNDGAGSGLNTKAARDAFGYSLNYYAGDYAAIEGSKWNNVADRFESGRAGSQLFGSRADLYNGNISAMVTNTSQPKSYTGTANEFPNYQPQGTAYKYDKLNRLKNVQGYQNINTTTNQWNTSGINPSRYLNSFEYDGNGNITKQLRLDGNGVQIDSLSYKYNRDANGLLNNRLRYVADASTSLPATAADDIETQAATNYGYDELGNLTKDEQEQILKIEWNVYGKIKKVIRTAVSTKSDLEFKYDAQGNRIAKIEKPHGSSVENGGSNQPTQWKTTYYVRDAQGNVMGNYYYTSPAGAASCKLLERAIYGSSRLGTENTRIELVGALPLANPYTRTLGNKYFEGTNHLGNVLSIFTDKKIPRDDNLDLSIDYFQPEIVACNDYTAFGAPMNERNFSVSKETGSVIYQSNFTSGVDSWINNWGPASNSTISTVSSQLRIVANVKYAGAAHIVTTIPGKQYRYTVNIASISNLAPNYLVYFARNGSGSNIVVEGTTTPGVYTLVFTAQETSTRLCIELNTAGASTQIASVKLELLPDLVYNYAFNGKTKDDEIKGAGNHIDFDERGYDPRLGRWFSVDPLFAKYPYQSPYSFVGNNPILNREVDGRDYVAYINHETKTITIKATYYTAKGDINSHTSAVQATQFWNEQSGKYQYTVGTGDNTVTYDIQFDLDVVEVESPSTEVNKDRLPSRVVVGMGDSKLTPDASSNTYGVLPDDNVAFKNGEEGKNTNGVTSGGGLIKVKDSRKATETGAHEVGHSLGLGHFFSGVLTAASNDPNRSSKISSSYVQSIISNLSNRNKDEEGKPQGGKGTVSETGKSPEDFKEGKVTRK